MQPYFYSLSEFLAMGKHGIYVWSSWGVTVTAVSLFIIYSVMQRRRLLHDLAIQQARQAQRVPRPPLSSTTASTESDTPIN